MKQTWIVQNCWGEFKKGFSSASQHPFLTTLLKPNSCLQAMQIGCEHTAGHAREPWYFNGFYLLLHHSPSRGLCWNNHIWAKELCWRKKVPCFCMSSSFFHVHHASSPSEHHHIDVAVAQQPVQILQSAQLESTQCPAQHAWRCDIIWSCWLALGRVISYEAADGRGSRLKFFGVQVRISQ